MEVAVIAVRCATVKTLRGANQLLLNATSRGPTTTPGMVAAINSVLAGVFVGLLLYGLFTLSLLVCTSAGVITFLLSLGIHQRHNWKQLRRSEQSIPVRFPSQAQR